MDIEEADAKAKKLYGSSACAKYTGYGDPDIVIKNAPSDGMDLSLGWGKTWEDAFTMAAERLWWHHFCNVDSAHGIMRVEPMYGTEMVIEQYGWFCAVDDCNGYGGPVEKRVVKKQKAGVASQMALFD